ncbi:MAG: hypothetical protein KDC61_14780, partial [Saprospiraceae bacterium]|nr:hypothetical protein [Saprospiraceae bacterium]
PRRYGTDKGNPPKKHFGDQRAIFHVKLSFSSMRSYDFSPQTGKKSGQAGANRSAAKSSDRLAPCARRGRKTVLPAASGSDA